MAINRYAISGYGQVEINNCAFRRDGRIEAQCALDATAFATKLAENGMLLAIDNVSRTVKLPAASNETGIIALNYSAEHIYDERTPGLKDFALGKDDVLPRLGYLAVGDKFTTNTVCYDTSVFANDAACKTACEAYKTTRVYGTTDVSGAIKLTTTKPQSGVVLEVIGVPGMPDGTFGVKLQVLAC